MSTAPRVAPITPVEGREGHAAGDYVPGVCNIGPREIRKRRAVALAALAAAAVLFAVLVATGAPTWTRLLLVLPLTGGAFSWLQARRRFCAGFAVAGVANFGNDDSTRQFVQDDAARRADLAAVRRMTRDAVLIAMPIAGIAILLPV